MSIFWVHYPIPYELRDYFHYGSFTVETNYWEPFENSIDCSLCSHSPKSLVWFLHTCCCFLLSCGCKADLAKSSRTISHGILSSLVLCSAHSSYLDLPGIPTLSRPLRETTQLYLGSTFLLCAIEIFYSVLGILLGSANLFFLSEITILNWVLSNVWKFLFRIFYTFLVA